MKPIRTAAVIGAGTMGTGIACHLASAGVRCHLLDMVPPEAAAGAGKAGAPSRSKLAEDALRRAAEGGAFLDPADRALVEPGNIEDHLERVRECDWIVEAIVERLDAKRDLFRRLAPLRSPEAVVSSNTSGIALKLLCEGLPEDFRKHFVITHFFNPPRHMYLLEVIPGPDTLPAVLSGIEEFASKRLGKGVVRCKDTPNFIANRIGVYAMAVGARFMEEEKLSIEEVDAITGRPMARPKTGSFSLLDLVGIDVAVLVQENAGVLLENDESRAAFAPTALLKRLVAEKRLGRKSGAGFYKKVGKDLLVLDPATFEYRPQREVKFASLEAAAKERDPGGRLRALLAGSDAASRYAWKLLSAVLLYSARRIPEISDDIVSVDRALRWGFSWELGPFEAWDAIGVRESTKRMQGDGVDPPPLVKSLLASGKDRFYDREGRDGSARRLYFDLGTKKHLAEPERPGVIILDDLRAGERPYPLELAGEPLAPGRRSPVRRVPLQDEHHQLRHARPGDGRRRGGGARRLRRPGDRERADNFSAGANIAELKAAAEGRNWKAIDSMIRKFHQCALRLRYSAKPVAAAVRGLCLGGGCEIPLACHRVQAAGENLYRAGRAGGRADPAGGGTREMACRAAEAIAPGVEADLFPFLRRAFETIVRGRMSGSGPGGAEPGVPPGRGRDLHEPGSGPRGREVRGAGHGRGRVPSAAAARGGARRGRLGPGGAEDHHPPLPFGGRGVRPRRAPGDQAGLRALRGRRRRRYDGAGRVSPRSRAGDVPEPPRRAEDAGADRPHAEDRQAAEELNGGAMRDAVIVTGVRTAVGKGRKGTLRNARPDDLAAAVIREAVARTPGLKPGDVEDVLLGCAFPEKEQGMNVARIATLRAGLPVEVPAATINRFCSSGLQTIAMAADRIRTGGAEIIIAGGTESMTRVEMMGRSHANPELAQSWPDVYLGMGLTAENLARRYGIGREESDRFSLESHQKAVAAISAGRFQDEIVPFKVESRRPAAEGKVESRSVEFKVDECPRTGHDARRPGEAEAGVRAERHRDRRQLVSDLRRRGCGGDHVRGPRPGDGAEAARGVPGLCRRRRVTGGDGHRSGEGGAEGAGPGGTEARGHRPHRAERGLRGPGTERDQRARPPMDRLNVNGGAVALGHPLGATGARLTVSILNELARRQGRHAMVTMCVGGGMGAAGIFERI
jgi:3-hydroxyacyl-CoA dehydrogenase